MDGARKVIPGWIVLGLHRRHILGTSLKTSRRPSLSSQCPAERFGMSSKVGFLLTGQPLCSSDKISGLESLYIYDPVFFLFSPSS